MPNKMIAIENSRFIFKTNFSGDPERDRYGSSVRKGNLVIPDPMQARELIDAGFNVKMTKPREGEEEDFVPTYYVSVIVNFDSNWPPNIYLVNERGEARPLDDETISTIDKIRVKNVNAILNPHKWKDGFTMYVKTMYVEQSLEDDPFASRYAKADEDEPEALPF